MIFPSKIIVRIIFFALYLIFFTLIFIEALAQIFPSLSWIYPFVHQGYSNICHQQNEKLISLGEGISTILCARCTGIYSGGLFSAVLLFIINPQPKLKIKFLIFAAVPLVLDVLFCSLGFYSYSRTIAFTTGWLLGSVGFLYFYIPFENLILNKNWR